MEIGIFQLLPAPEALGDREVIEQALWEVDFAEEGGFGSVWIAEHHLSSFGLVGAPSVYAAAVAGRTRRVDIGYAVAVLPIHHPLRLAEEIAWVDHLSHGRLLVGLGPGFSAYELGAFGVPLGERQDRFEEGIVILRRALAGETFSHSGRFWSFPPVTLRPRSYRGFPPPLLRASTSLESLHEAAVEGVPVMLGLKPAAEIAARVAAYRAVRASLGRSAVEIDREIAEFRVLRRVSLASTDEEALADAAQALQWEATTALRIHGTDGGGRQGTQAGDGSAVGDRSVVEEPPQVQAVTGGCIGTPGTVSRELAALSALGIRHVIAWLSFGNMPFAKVRRSMELLRREVLPELAAIEAKTPRGISAHTQNGISISTTNGPC